MVPALFVSIFIAQIIDTYKDFNHINRAGNNTLPSKINMYVLFSMNIDISINAQDKIDVKPINPGPPKMTNVTITLTTFTAFNHALTCVNILVFCNCWFCCFTKRIH